MVQYSRMAHVVSNCLPVWCMEHNYDFHDGGKFWVCWDPSLGTVQLPDKGEQFVMVKVKLISIIVFCATFVYTSTDAVIRRELWDYMVCTTCNTDIPWLVMGEFNSVIDPHERVGGTQVHPAQIVDFYDCVAITGLMDMKFTGIFLTWSNRHTYRISSKLAEF